MCVRDPSPGRKGPSHKGHCQLSAWYTAMDLMAHTDLDRCTKVGRFGCVAGPMIICLPCLRRIRSIVAGVPARSAVSSWTSWVSTGRCASLL